jgi:hypothetical protein
MEGRIHHTFPEVGGVLGIREGKKLGIQSVMDAE